MRFLAWVGAGWAVWRWAVHQPHLLHRVLEFGFFLAPLLLLLFVYRKVNRQPVVW